MSFRLPSSLLCLVVAGALTLGSPTSAQITVLDSFTPIEVSSLCSLAYDAVDDEVWVYECFGTELHSYATDGTFLGAIPRPSDSANDVDLESAPEALSLGDTTLPAGTLLFINGEYGPAEIHALDKTDGTILATLNTAFGVSHVVGGAYSPLRDTFFLVQDRVPGTEDENRVAEIDPVSGAVLNTFQIGDTFDVNYGDLEVSAETGNLFVVSSAENRIAEYLPDGSFVAYHDLPDGVSSLSGIGLDCAAREAWVSRTSGIVYRMGDVPCGVGCPLSFNNASITPLTVAPGERFTVSVNVANAGPGPQTARLSLDYARDGGGPSGALTLGRGTVPVTSGVSANLNQRVPAAAPGGSYTLDLNLVDDASGTVCDTRPFTLTVQSARVAGSGTLLEAAPPATNLFTAAIAPTATPVRILPNPVRDQADIRVTLDAAADVRLTMYDVLGRVVAVPVAERLPAGSHAVRFDASTLPDGIYVYRLVAGPRAVSGRITVVR